MSLVPYHPREGREIVLRHHDAIVVRDPSSQRLEIRGLELHECPTCHQPLRSSSPERHFDNPDHDESYVNPEYFRMLRAGHDARTAPLARPPPSPVRRLVEPFRANTNDDVHAEAEFVRSSPAPQSSRIRRESFSPNYFNAFFIEERELGRGGKGVVLLVRHEIDGCNLGHFACKRVPVGDDHAWLEKVLVEVELLAKLSHPNLVSYRHVWLEDVHLNRFGPSVVCAFILQQYCNSGDLQNHVLGGIPKEATKEELKAQMRRRSKGQAERPQLQKRLPPEEIYSLFKDITSGLAYLHAANYIHRDLKPSNCLLHRDGTRLKCLISDFGEVQAENVIRKSTGSTGTISYCAPEVLKRDASGRYGNFTTKSDVFSLGMILYFMCFGRLPYINANSVHEELEDIDQLRAEISGWKGFQDERKERPDLPSKLYQLLKKLLSVNPAERPTANEVLYAMRGESPFDGVRRGSRSTSPPIGLGLAGQRIQNLDSPMPASTPSPAHPAKPTDPTKHARVTASPDVDLPNPSASYSHNPDTTAAAHSTATSGLLTKRISPPSPTSPLHPRGHAMAISLSNRSHTSTATARGLSPERPSPGPSTPDLAATTAAAAADLPTITISTPLLMAPPPTTGLGRVRQGAVVSWFRGRRWVRAHAAVLQLGLFVGKMVSLSWVCWPYSAGWMVLGTVRFGGLCAAVGREGWGGGGGQDDEMRYYFG
ncbi:kinase-like protein [Trichocladium antarcticum]|uniref:non-specific serine/threonine protein kinase n=1 Tax=Trichocladium antarcticum TaxID=1450529 RepID=A0AAN6UCR1_9PEZI|nr:kinase-like protein [Trichocladium antarcticum]